MKRKKIYVAVAIFIAMFSVLSFDDFYDAYKAEQTIVKKIEKSLNANCDCDDISKDMYSKGIQYSKNEGFSVEKIAFTLKNCNFTSLKEEKERIHKILLRDIVGLKSFNLVTLDIISEDRHDTVTIRNGKLEL